MTTKRPAILGSAVYLPRFRAGTGRRRVTVRNGDEDALTLAVAAAQSLISNLGSVPEIDEVHLAVGRPDLVDGPQPQVLREALGLSTDLPGGTFAGDALAGLTALTAATDAVAAGRSRAVLVLASEPGDGVRVSAAAVALLVARAGAGPSLRVLGQRSHAEVVYGNWVDGQNTRHPGDGRYLEHAVTGLATRVWRLLADSGVTRAGPATSGTAAPVDGPGDSAMSAPDMVTGVAAAAVARACGADPTAVLPDHGVAGPLLALLRAADAGSGPTDGSPASPGRTVHILAVTAGRVVGIAAHADPGGPSWRPPETDDDAGLPVEPECSPPLSLPTSSPFFQRASRELLRLEGARCRRCGQVMFPPSQRPVCSGCQGYDFEPVALSRTGSVHTYVVNRFLPRGFGDEMTLVLGEMDDGSRYWAPTSGIHPGELAIGHPVELRLRRFTDHGGAPAYAMKFTAREEPA